MTFAGKMNQLSGREHFFNGILNVLEGINSVLSPIRDGFGDVFMTDGSPLYNFLKGFDELTGKMALSEETAEKGAESIYRRIPGVEHRAEGREGGWQDRFYDPWKAAGSAEPDG